MTSVTGSDFVSSFCWLHLTYLLSNQVWEVAKLKLPRADKLHGMYDECVGSFDSCVFVGLPVALPVKNQVNLKNQEFAVLRACQHNL